MQQPLIFFETGYSQLYIKQYYIRIQNIIMENKKVNLSPYLSIIKISIYKAKE